MGLLVFKGVVDENGTALAAKTIIVDAGGNGNYTTIQAAINAADPGDTIRVWAGTYYENLKVNKTVSLVGNGSMNTIIDGGRNGDVIHITKNWVNFTNLMITNSSITNDYYALRFYSVNNCTVENCNISNNKYGIRFTSDYNKILNNSFYNNTYAVEIENSNFHIINNNTLIDNYRGIQIIESENCTINYNTCFSNDVITIYFSRSLNCKAIKNSIKDDRIGITLSSSSNITLKNNTMFNCSLDFLGSEIYPGNDHNIDTSNTVNNKPIYYWKNINGGKIPSGAGEIILANCSNITVEGQNCSNGSYGIILTKSVFCNISNNSVYSNKIHGISISSSNSLNRLENNTVRMNGEYGIFLSSADRTLVKNNDITMNSNGAIYSNGDFTNITNNTITNNGLGIYLRKNRYNFIIDNNISMNGYFGIQVEESSHNTISNNSILKNEYGMKTGGYDRIENNTIRFNIEHGILYSSSYNTIMNNYITNNGQDGIWVASKSRYSKIYNNNISLNSGNGIFFWGWYPYKSLPLYNTIKNNMIVSNNNSGVFITWASSNYFVNNKINYNEAGISMGYSYNNKINNNIILGNEYGIHLGNEASSNEIANNTVVLNTKHGIEAGYKDRISYNNISFNNWSGIILGSDSNTVDNNEITHNQDGITIQNADTSKIKYNNIMNNVNGLVFTGYSKDNLIYDNLVSNNSGDGFNFTSTSTGNYIYYNSIINNTNQAIDNGNNTWNNTKQRGNYWSDYKGLDNGASGRVAGDGIGDINVPHLGLDYYPLMVPWSQPNIVYVDDDFTNATLGWNWTRFDNIQDGIYEVKSGGTVKVYEGTYYENVKVTKPLTLIGNGSENTTINGGGSGDVVFITASWTIISGLKITNSGNVWSGSVKDAGIELNYVEYVNINNVSCDDNLMYGLFLLYSHNNSIETCTFNSNNEIGIRLEYSNYNTIKNNSIKDNTYNGFVSEYSDNNLIFENNCTWFTFTGSDYNIIANNIGGSWMRSSNYNKLINNTSNDGTYGFRMSSAFYNKVVNNTCNNNERYGFYLENVGSNLFSNNTCFDNLQTAFYIEGGSYNRFVNNTMTGTGIFLYGALSTWNTQNIDLTNTLDGKPVYYLTNATSGTVPPGNAQVILGNCMNVVIENQNLSGGTVGIELGYSDDNIIANNTCNSNTFYGIYMDHSDNNRIINNTCNDNYFYGFGMKIKFSDYNRIWNNTCNNNSNSGIEISGSSSTTVWGNSIYNNTCGGNVYGIEATSDVDSATFTYNNCSGNTKYGIYFNYRVFDCEVSNNTCNSNTLVGICLVSQANSNTVSNNICNNNTEGIYSSCMFNKFINNSCTMNQNGIKINNNNIVAFKNKCIDNAINGIYLNSVRYSTISNNTCNSNNGNGLYAWYSDDNTITDNTCFSNGDSGFNLSDCDDNTIEQNTCEDNDYGMKFHNNCVNNEIINNTCNSNKVTGLKIFDWARSNKVINTSCSNNNGIGILIDYTLSNAILDSNISDNTGGGIYVYDSDYTVVESCTISNNTATGIYFTKKSANCELINSTIAGTTTPDIKLNDQSYLTTLNTTFDPYDVTIADTKSQLTVRWFMHIRVTNMSGLPIPDAKITIVDNSSTQLYYGTPDANGWKKWIYCTEYIEKWLGKTSILTPYNVSAQHNAYEPYYVEPEPDMNQTRTIYIKLRKDIYPPDPPTFLQFTSIGGHHLNFTWTPSGSKDVLGYNIYLNNTGSSTNFHLLDVTDKTYFNATGLAEETLYYFEIKAHDKVPWESSALPGSKTTLDITPPEPPTGLNIIKVGGNRIQFNWTASVSSDVTAYEIYVNDTGSTTNFHLLGFTTLTKYDHNGLPEETKYYYKIRAIDEVPLFSVFSNTLSATTLDITTPAAPTNLHTKDVTGHTVTLTWDLNTELDLAGYHIFMNNTIADPTGPFHRIHTIVGSTTQYVVTNLYEFTQYYFTVVAFDEVPNNSSFSNVVSVKTLDATPPTIMFGSGNILTTTGEDFELFAKIQDNIEMGSVKIFYTKSTVWQEKTILYSIYGNYSTTNGDLSIDTTSDISPWKYYFYAKDSSGNYVYYGTQQNPFIITVIDNDKPVADAGEDIESKDWDTVIFDASGSYDNIGITNYSWAFEYQNEQIILYGKTTEFIFKEGGSYEIKLVVSDAAGNTAEDTLTLHVYQRLTSKIELISPSNHSQLPGPKVTLSWDGSCNAPCIVTYNVYFGTSPDPPLYKSNFENESLEVLIFEERVDYYWKVQLIVSGSPGPISDIWSFQVSHAVPKFGVEITTEDLEIQQGESKTIFPTIRNNGNTNDWIKLQINTDFPGTVNLEANRVYLGPDQEQAISIKLTAENTAPEGVYWLTLTITSEGALEYGLSVNDSIKIRVFVQLSPSTDSDNDNIPDLWEKLFDLNPKDPSDAFDDPDKDGLQNLDEYLLNTDPRNPDSDGDGLSDYTEVNEYKTDATNPDTDGDGYNDGEDAYPLDETRWDKETEDKKDKPYDWTPLFIGVIVIVIIIILIFLLIIRPKLGTKIEEVGIKQEEGKVPKLPGQFNTPTQVVITPQIYRQIDQRYCSSCDQGLKYIQQNNRYYCDYCRKYE